MLVLSRLHGEEIIINGNIRVTLIEARPGKARIGIEAPSDIVVHRAEVQRIVDQEARMEVFNETLHAQSKRNPARQHPVNVPPQSPGES